MQTSFPFKMFGFLESNQEQLSFVQAQPQLNALVSIHLILITTVLFIFICFSPASLSSFDSSALQLSKRDLFEYC